jgi:hypothetical protein
MSDFSCQDEQVETGRRQTVSSPEIYLLFSGFFLNFFWEMAQSPLYDDVYRMTYLEILRSRLHCTLGDVLILLGGYWIVAWMVKDRYWVVGFRVRHVMGFTLLGLGYTILSEWINVDIRSAWGYGATMPRVPLVGAGLAPFMQWVLLPPLIAGVTRGFILGRAVSRGRKP